MGLIKAFGGAISGTFADQWRDIITVDSFNETIAVMPGIRKETNRSRGSNTKASDGIITNGSKIYVPESTIAVIFDQAGIEGVISEPGGYEYRNGEKSILSGDGIWKSIIEAIDERFDFGGQPSDNKRIIFINLREIRNIRFGTNGPLLYHDHFYDSDLEIVTHGTFSIRITKPVTFIKNFLPANATFYDFGNREANAQIISEIMESLIIVLNKLSNMYRTSDLPAHAREISEAINSNTLNVGSWDERYGFELVTFAIRNIEFSDDSKELVKQYSANKMNVAAYDNAQKRSADIAFQQGIAKGVQEHGLGDGAGMVMGMNIMQDKVVSIGKTSNVPINEQVEIVKKLKELVDIGAITREEFDVKKKEIMGL